MTPSCNWSQRSPVQISRAFCSRRRATISRNSSRKRKRRRRSSSPVLLMCARCCCTTSHKASTPSPVEPMVGTIGGRHASCGKSERSSICSRSRRVSSTPLRSALLITNTSAISMRPALFACTESPQPGFTTTTVVSALPAISTSTWPTPTVSTKTHKRPIASSNRIASGAANDKPPK